MIKLDNNGILGMAVQAISHDDIFKALKANTDHIMECDRAMEQLCVSCGIDPKRPASEYDPLVIESIRSIRSDYLKERNAMRSQLYVRAEDLEEVVRTIVESIESHAKQARQGCRV